MLGKEDEDEDDDVEGLAGKLYRKPVIAEIRNRIDEQSKFWAMEGWNELAQK